MLADYDTFLMAEAALTGISVRIEDDFTEMLNEGVARLKRLGFIPAAKLVRGQSPPHHDAGYCAIRR